MVKMFKKKKKKEKHTHTHETYKTNHWIDRLFKSKFPLTSFIKIYASHCFAPSIIINLGWFLIFNYITTTNLTTLQQNDTFCFTRHTKNETTRRRRQNWKCHKFLETSTWLADYIVYKYGSWSEIIMIITSKLFRISIINY